MFEKNLGAHIVYHWGYMRRSGEEMEVVEEIPFQEP
jgi:hypothetical protein